MTDAYVDSRADRWGVSRADFQAALDAALARGVADPAALHLEDLAIAVACAAGNEAAWEHVVRTYQPQLLRAADAMDRTGRAREQADALFGELFAPPARGGAGASLFRYFHGRSALGTWLRAVLAQRHIDALRASRRLEPLDDLTRSGTEAVRDVPVTDADSGSCLAAVRAALAAGIGALDARDRLRLKLYYLDDLTLAAIGRLTREHEATVSRHLARTRREVRAAVEAFLRDERGLDAARIAECLRSVAIDPGTIDLAEVLSYAR